MKPDLDVIARIKRHEADLRHMGVANLSIFGSRARGDYTSESDIDVLIGWTSDAKLTSKYERGMAELGISGTLSEITGLDVSLLERGKLSVKFADRISDDIVEVF